jgi:methionyl-tRNA formyltransferase
MKILFMGTPTFAKNHLEGIYKNHEIVGVFTSVPKPTGRKKVLTKSPVHVFAQSQGIDVYNVKTLRNSDIINTILKLDADVIVVVSFGFILPKEILYSKKYGCINIHPSDLPKYRGPSPIQYSILKGENTSAVCLMKLDEGVDTGPVLIKESFDINDTDDIESVTLKAETIGVKLLNQYLNSPENFRPVEQSLDQVSLTKKITSEDGLIDFYDHGINIVNKIRALKYDPGAYFMHQDVKYKIYHATFVSKKHSEQIGALNKDGSIYCQDGVINIQIIQKTGKNILPIKDFLNGLR